MRRVLDYLKQHKKRVILIALLVIAILDIADPPMFWQVFAVQNKIAIMNYVDEKYPGAKVIGYDLATTELFHTSLGLDRIYFEYNDVEFTVVANDGEVSGDTYAQHKAEKYIDENYLIPFFEQKGVSPQYTQYAPISEGEDLSHYDGTYRLKIIQDDMSDEFVPGKLDWFYDFYVYWIDNIELPVYSVTLLYDLTNGGYYSLSFHDESPYYSTAEEFYAAFRYQ